VAHSGSERATVGWPEGERCSTSRCTASGGLSGSGIHGHQPDPVQRRQLARRRRYPRRQRGPSPRNACTPPRSCPNYH